MAELQPIIVFHGRHFVHHLGICNPICVKLLQIMSGVIVSNLKEKQRLYLKPFSWGSHTHTHTRTHARTLARTHARARARARARTHTHTDTHTDPYTHTWRWHDDNYWRFIHFTCLEVLVITDIIIAEQECIWFFEKILQDLTYTYGLARVSVCVSGCLSICLSVCLCITMVRPCHALAKIKHLKKCLFQIVPFANEWHRCENCTSCPRPTFRRSKIQIDTFPQRRSPMQVWRVWVLLYTE